MTQFRKRRETRGLRTEFSYSLYVKTKREMDYTQQSTQTPAGEGNPTDSTEILVENDVHWKWFFLELARNCTASSVTTKENVAMCEIITEDERDRKLARFGGFGDEFVSKLLGTGHGQGSGRRRVGKIASWFYYECNFGSKSKIGFDLASGRAISREAVFGGTFFLPPSPWFDISGWPSRLWENSNMPEHSSRLCLEKKESCLHINRIQYFAQDVKKTAWYASKSKNVYIERKH